MTIDLFNPAWDAAHVDLLAVGVYTGQPLAGAARDVDARLHGAIQEALASHEFDPKPGASLLIHTLGAVPARRVLAVGLGEADAADANVVRAAYGRVAERALAIKAAEVAVELWGAARLGARRAAQVAAEGLLLGGWTFPGYRQTDEERVVPHWHVLADGNDAAAGLGRGRVLAEAANLARELGQTPANLLYPEVMAEKAREAVAGLPVEVEVLDETALLERGMGAILAIGQGSVHPPRMVILRYRGGPRTLALVGKGITFDAGGISLKPAQGMEEMKYDMLGAASVLAAVRASAQLGLGISVIGILCLAENLPGGRASRPGDVVRAFNGKSIEITNTDAEGRVVLADGVSYAAHLGAEWIVDAATLTGAVVTVLGHEATGLVATDDALAAHVLEAADLAGERTWRLPIYPEYKDLYRSEVADLKNSPGRDAGTITGGMIIAEFAGGKPFAHLDIAGTAWRKEGPLNRRFGPTGIPVRTLVELATRLASAPTPSTT
jgi:leucyl aminopeptidase